MALVMLKCVCAMDVFIMLNIFWHPLNGNTDMCHCHVTGSISGCHKLNTKVPNTSAGKLPTLKPYSIHSMYCCLPN